MITVRLLLICVCLWHSTALPGFTPSVEEIPRESWTLPSISINIHARISGISGLQPAENKGEERIMRWALGNDKRGFAGAFVWIVSCELTPPFSPQHWPSWPAAAFSHSNSCSSASHFKLITDGKTFHLRIKYVWFQ